MSQSVIEKNLTFDRSKYDAFFDDLEKLAPEIEKTEVLPNSAHVQAALAGCYGLTVPKKYSGFGMEMAEYLPLLEKAAMGPGIGRMLVHLTNGIWRPLEMFGTPDQKGLIDQIVTGEVVVAFCLTEQTGGTGLDLHSRATLEGETWRISGEKHWITFADRATHFVLVVKSGDKELTSFLIPRNTPGLEIDSSQYAMGLHGTGHAFLRYQEMEVPDSCRLGSVGQGLEVALSFLDYSRVSLSNSMVGLAQRALDESIKFAKRRKTSGKVIADRQAIQGHLAMMHADVQAGRYLVQFAAKQYSAGKNFTVEAATAKLFCLNMVGRVTDLALRVHGGLGFSKASVVERIYRDARGFWFEEGTAEIQQLVIARGLLDSVEQN
jgi:alkylation response protein AidB-like acyl-CoA dehydrogenase